MTYSIIFGASIIIVYVLYFIIKVRVYIMSKDPMYEVKKESHKIINQRIKAVKEDYYSQKFKNIKNKFSSQNIKFKNSNDAFLFACENSANLEQYQPLVGIVRGISTSRYIHDITQFAPKYTVEIAFRESPFMTESLSTDREYEINIGDLVLWIPGKIEPEIQKTSGSIFAVIKPELSIHTGWKIKKVFQ